MWNEKSWERVEEIEEELRDLPEDGLSFHLLKKELDELIFELLGEID